MKQLTARFGQGTLARNTLSMMAGHGARSVIQAFYFVVIARALGATGYGAFMAVASFVAFLAPFASIGSGNVLIMNVARDPKTFPRYWGNAKTITLTSGTILVLLVVGLSRFVLPETISVALLISVALADLIFARLADISGQAFQAFERLNRTAQIMVSLNVSRIIAALVFVAAVHPTTATGWGYLYLASGVGASVLALFLVERELGKGQQNLSGVIGDLKLGALFSVSLSSQSLYNDIDKTMLAKMSTLAAAGTYAAAYRVIDVAFTPVRSLLFAAYARFFQFGASGIKGSLSLAKRLVPAAAIYAISMGVVLFLVAPVIPRILGRDFSNAVSALRWLSALPLLKSLHYFAGDTLSGSGEQRLRSVIQVGIAIFNLGINFWLIPAYGWLGAAWASLASDGLLAICLWAAVSLIGRRSAVTK